MFNEFISHVDAFIHADDGATAIEYGLIAAGISVAIVAVVFPFGDELVALFGNLQGELEDANTELKGGGGGGGTP
jgi:pilus assembly protein Flp/PilA